MLLPEDDCCPSCQVVVVVHTFHMYITDRTSHSQMDLGSEVLLWHSSALFLTVFLPYHQESRSCTDILDRNEKLRNTSPTLLRSER